MNLTVAFLFEKLFKRIQKLVPVQVSLAQIRVAKSSFNQLLAASEVVLLICIILLILKTPGYLDNWLDLYVLCPVSCVLCPVSDGVCPMFYVFCPVSFTVCI